MNLKLESTTDILLFIARTFFLPPKDHNAIPAVDITSMNDEIPPNHPWVVFNRSLSSLCTLRATQNNVFGIMLLPSGGPEGKATDPEDVAKVQFLCADNRDEETTKGLPYFVTECLKKILAASEAEERGEKPAVTRVINSFIGHVYSNSWTKFCRRMTKANKRGDRLLQILRAREELVSRPSSLDTLINAVSSILTVINGNPSGKGLKRKDYLAVHSACALVRKEAFRNIALKRWLSELRFPGQQQSDPCTPFHVIEKMVKIRTGIESLRRLIINADMRPTFRGARAAMQDNAAAVPIEWVRAPPLGTRTTVEVNLHRDAHRIKEAYKKALSSRPDAERQTYATAEEMWDRIETKMGDVREAQLGRGWKLGPDKTTFFYTPAERSQHCEGRLLRHVIKDGLLGKVFPYIGCSKLCCEPCFTAIRAVNELIREKLHPPEQRYFTAEGSHRKIYPGFAITPTTRFDDEDIIERFNTILCCDIGLVVKARAEKGLGHSDSAPEPDSPEEEE